MMMEYGVGQAKSNAPSVHSHGACGLPPHGLSSHDSGIDISSSDMEYNRVEVTDRPNTQEIHYQDTSLSDDSSQASFSESGKYSEESERQELVGELGLKVDRAPRSGRNRRRRSPPKATFDINDNSLLAIYTFIKGFLGASSTSTVAIDNKIEQAMDLVKSHLMFAVREEVEVLKEKILELMDQISSLECENTMLRQYAPAEALQQIQQTQSQSTSQGTQPPHHGSS